MPAKSSPVSAPVLRPDEVRSAATVPIGAALERWRLALGDGRPQHPLLSLLGEWGEWAGLDHQTMVETVLTAEARVQEEWETVEAADAEAVRDFYARTETLIPLLIWWHGTDFTPARCACAASSVLRAAGARRVLDFGAGIGSTSVLMSREGLEPILAEVSSAALDFARARLARRGYEAPCIDPSGSLVNALGANSLDGIVCFDVLEHLHDVTPTLEEFDGLLADGGVMCLNQVWVPEDDDHVGHFRLRGEVLRWLHAHGYRMVHVRDVMWVAQKTDLKGTEQLRQAAVLRSRVACASFVEGRTRTRFRGLGHQARRLAVG